MRSLVAPIICLGFAICPAQGFSEEIVVESISLPGASLEQEIIYHPSKKTYIAACEARIAALQKKDPEAYVNPIDGPWMIAETTAMVGFEIGVDFKGLSVGSVKSMSGRKHLRRVTAAEDALYRFEKGLACPR